MNEPNTQLAETFSAHEHLAPDAAEVLAKAHGIARACHRRRWAVRATGGAVLTAAVVAGGVGVAGDIGNASSNRPAGSTETALLAPGDSAPAPSPSPTYTEDQELTAYFEGGYDYNNALALAKAWNSTGDIASVKAAAGLKLLEGGSLPVTPNQAPATPAERADDAFFAAGYDYNDAVALGALWHETDINKVKVEAGAKLEAGQTLPIAPGSAPAAPGGASSQTQAQVQADRARAAFFAAGYSYDDAVRLAQAWHESDTFQVKAQAGQKLLDGETLPIAP
jgi:hypothetical protein